jgi:hypothetical protein
MLLVRYLLWMAGVGLFSAAALCADSVQISDGLQATPVSTISSVDYGSMALSAHGDYLVTFDDVTRIWDVARAREIGTLADVGPGRPPNSVAILDDPCVGVASEYGTYDAADPYAAANLSVFSCQGEKLASLPVKHLARGSVSSATAVPACGLIVMQFAHGVVVVDGKSRTVRPELSKIFPNEVAVVAAAWRSCVVYVGVNGSRDASGRLFRIDLTARTISDVVLSSDAGSTGIAYFPKPMATVSPDDTRLAVVVSRRKPPVGELSGGAERVELFDVTAGRVLHVVPLSRLAGHVVDGLVLLDFQRAALISYGGPHTLQLIDFSGDAATVTSPSKAFGFPFHLTYAPARRRLAVRNDKTVAVFDLQN